MTYSDPTDFVTGTDGAHSDTNVAEANIQHVIVQDDAGNTYDYLIVEGNSGDTELYTMAADGTLTLEQTLAVGTTESGKFDPFTVIQDNDSNAVYMFDEDRDGVNIVTWDPATATWSSASQDGSEFHASGLVYADVFQADDGTIYAYTGSSAARNELKQFVFDETTGTFSPDTSYVLSTDLGQGLGGYEAGTETGGIHVLMTNDGPKLMQWHDGGVARTEGFTLYDIDPATGDLVAGSASSYNFAKDSEVTNFGMEAEFNTGADGGVQDIMRNEQANTVTVDANGNIVIMNGLWGTSETKSYGMIVIDPSLSVPDSADATQDGDGDVDNSASVLAAYEEIGSTSLNNGTVSAQAWGSNPIISYSPDGNYMYITSSNTTGSLDSADTATIVVDTSTYDIVDWGFDTTSGMTSTDASNSGTGRVTTHGAMSQIIVNHSSGNNFYVEQSWDTSNTTSGWLAVSDVTASIVNPNVVVCFTSGTMIETDRGEVAIDDLAIGDMVKTKDHGFQAIRWIGSSLRKAEGDLAPILIKAGALGNTSDLRVSPQHRMLLQDWQVEVLFGEGEVLVPAKHLVNGETILREEGGEVEYFHILFDQHEIIFAEGAPSESFFIGEESRNGLNKAQVNEILEIFPELDPEFKTANGSFARLVLSGKEGKVIANAFH